MWMACIAIKDIAAVVDMTPQRVGQIISDFENNSTSGETFNFRNFEPQVYTTCPGISPRTWNSYPGTVCSPRAAIDRLGAGAGRPGAAVEVVRIGACCAARAATSSCEQAGPQDQDVQERGRRSGGQASSGAGGLSLIRRLRLARAADFSWFTREVHQAFRMDVPNRAVLPGVDLTLAAQPGDHRWGYS